MSVEPRAALDRLIEAFEAHLKVLASGRGEDDPAFQNAQDILVSAFETYDEALFDAYEIDTPFLVYDEDDVEEEDFDDADGEDPSSDDDPLIVGDLDDDGSDDGEDDDAVGLDDDSHDER